MLQSSFTIVVFFFFLPCGSVFRAALVWKSMWPDCAKPFLMARIYMDIVSVRRAFCVIEANLKLNQTQKCYELLEKWERKRTMFSTY